MFQVGDGRSDIVFARTDISVASDMSFFYVHRAILAGKSQNRFGGVFPPSWTSDTRATSESPPSPTSGSSLPNMLSTMGPPVPPWTPPSSGFQWSPNPTPSSQEENEQFSSYFNDPISDRDQPEQIVGSMKVHVLPQTWHLVTENANVLNIVLHTSYGL